MTPFLYPISRGQDAAMLYLWHCNTSLTPFATADANMGQYFHCLQWYAGSERVNFLQLWRWYLQLKFVLCMIKYKIKHTKLWIVKKLIVWRHMISPPPPCHKLSHFLRPPPPFGAWHTFWTAPLKYENRKNHICVDSLEGGKCQESEAVLKRYVLSCQIGQAALIRINFRNQLWLKYKFSAGELCNGDVMEKWKFQEISFVMEIPGLSYFNYWGSGRKGVPELVDQWHRMLICQEMFRHKL